MDVVRAARSQHDDAHLPLVDFKWPMAGVGWWIDVRRMQRDAGYADQ